MRINNIQQIQNKQHFGQLRPPSGPVMQVLRENNCISWLNILSYRHAKNKDYDIFLSVVPHSDSWPWEKFLVAEVIKTAKKSNIKYENIDMPGYDTPHAWPQPVGKVVGTVTSADKKYEGLSEIYKRVLEDVSELCLKQK